MSAIQKRIIKELHNGTVLSVKNMWKLRASCCGREVVRCFEKPFNIRLDRKTIKWKDEFSHGWYFAYSLNPKDREAVKELYNEYVLGIKKVEK